jgi:hypothetical protein
MIDVCKPPACLSQALVELFHGVVVHVRAGGGSQSHRRAVGRTRQPGSEGRMNQFGRQPERGEAALVVC